MMASSKKSLSDKFAMEAKQKSPGKKPKKTSKVSKSLSRELTKAPSSPSSSKRATKSNSDSLVTATRDRSSESPSRTGKSSEASGTISKVFQKKDEVMKKVKGKKDSKQITQSSSRDSSPAKTQILAVEKLETSLETTWHKPKDTSIEMTSPVMSLTSSSISNVSSTAECSSISSNIMSSTDSSGLTDMCNTSCNAETNSSLSDANSSLSDVFMATTTATASSIPPAHSTDSLASEMESYKLGMARSSGSFSSDLETIKLDDSVCEADEINMSECSSTSTPVRFSLPSEQDKLMHTRRPPKFSLIRDSSRHIYSSSYSPPTSGLRPLESRHRLEELSDEGESSRSYRELSEHDELDVHSHSHFVPLNKQLQIVTSMERLLDRGPRRRSHSPPKDQGLLHQVSYRLPFVDYMKRNGLSTYIYYLPADMTMDKFRLLTRDVLVQQYNIVDPGVLERLQKAIRRAKEEDTTDEESDYGSIGSAPLSPVTLRRSHDEAISPLQMHGGIRRLQRTLSEDNNRRRESMPTTPMGIIPPSMGIPAQCGLGHSVGALIEPTNLMKMKGSLLGQSAPSLCGAAAFGGKELSFSRRSSNRQRKSVGVAPNKSPVLQARCPSPQIYSWIADNFTER